MPTYIPGTSAQLYSDTDSGASRASGSADNQDQLSARFFNPTTQTQIELLDITSYTLVSDFFVEPDAFSIEIEDDRIHTFLNQCSVGYQVEFLINKIPVLFGYVDSMTVSYTRKGGEKLTIAGRDILGVCQDSTIRPNISGTSSFHFNANTPFNEIMKGIFSDFPAIANFDFTSNDLSLATGFSTGVRTLSKTGRRLPSTAVGTLNYDSKPIPVKSRIHPGFNHYESYLGYAKRLCELAGFQIKMIPGSGSGNFSNQTMYIGSPVYDRSEPTQFLLVQTANGAASQTPDLFSNIFEASAKSDWLHQPTVVIGKCTSGAAAFNKQNNQVIGINEITGYLPNTNTPVPGVTNYISNLISNGYPILPYNIDLANVVPPAFIPAMNGTNRPVYFEDDYAQTVDELKWKVANELSKFQQKFFTLHYEVKGHTQNGAIWQPNMMVNVVDDILVVSGGSPTYWIQKRTFTRTRGQGTRTTLELALPYIYNPSNTPNVNQ